MLPKRCVFKKAVRPFFGMEVLVCMSSSLRALPGPAPEQHEDFFEMSLGDPANEPYQVISASRQTQGMSEVSVSVSAPGQLHVWTASV